MNFSLSSASTCHTSPSQVRLLPEVGERTIRDSSEPVVSPLPLPQVPSPLPIIFHSSPSSDVELKPQLQHLLPWPPPPWHSSPVGLCGGAIVGTVERHMTSSAPGGLLTCKSWLPRWVGGDRGLVLYLVSLLAPCSWPSAKPRAGVMTLDN